MSLVKQTHELPCTDETLACSKDVALTQHFLANDQSFSAPWKVSANWIMGSKPFRKDVSQATAKSEVFKAAAIQRTYFPVTIR